MKIIRKTHNEIQVGIRHDSGPEYVHLIGGIIGYHGIVDNFWKVQFKQNLFPAYNGSKYDLSEVELHKLIET